MHLGKNFQDQPEGPEPNPDFGQARVAHGSHLGAQARRGTRLRAQVSKVSTLNHVQGIEERGSLIFNSNEPLRNSGSYEIWS